MGPKVRAATRFLRGGGQVAVITTPRLGGGDAGAATDRDDASVGTRIVPARRAQGVSRMTVSTRLFPDTYVDSVVQLAACGRCASVDGVDWASAAMATPANVETLHGRGGRGRDLTAGAGANDFFLVVRAPTTQTAAAALAAGESAVFAARPTAATRPRARSPRSLRDAVRRAARERTSP